MGEKDLDAVDVLGHAVHDVARIQAIRARRRLGFKLVVEVVAQHGQGVEGHEVPGELLEVASCALEQAHAHGAHDDEGDGPGAGADGQAPHGPTAQGEQSNPGHQEDDARGDRCGQRGQDATRDGQEPNGQVPAGHRIVPSWSVATRSASLMVASR